MSNKIINKVDDAELMTIDINSFCVNGERKELNLIDWLDDELIIREKSFRQKLDSFPWETMNNAFVAVFCSKDVILPPWSYLLIQAKLHNVAKQVFFCNSESLNLLLFQQSLNNLDIKKYTNKRVFLKGCGGRDIPLAAVSLCVHRLMPHVKSLFYGEPCSNVPLIKN